MAPRKAHQKSRRGCVECKRRHVKCDETRPTCQRCTLSERLCTWEALRNVHESRSASSQAASETHAQSPAQPQSQSQIASRPPSPVTHAISTRPHSPSQNHGGSSSDVLITGPSDISVNMDHLELIYHFYTETCQTLVKTEDQLRRYRALVVEQGLKRPFLMHQILAFSALHLSLRRPQRQDYYRGIATALQTKALAGLTEILPQVDASNCLDVLLFSHLIGLHVFRDIFTSLKDDFNAFMEALVGCIRLLQGVNVVIRSWRDVLRRTEIGSLMDEAEDARMMQKNSLGECLPLHELMDNADLSQPSIDACQKALNKLQEFFHIENAYPEDRTSSANAIFGWLVTASTKYTELLAQKRQEALVLLAYYAVLLHRRRESWVVGNAGRRLFKALTTHLGSGWEPFLAWPRSVFHEDEDLGPTPVSTSS
ncbi:hypothetical protein EDD36DRAFT_231916 [Exophiala viscosa]|uniref:Zn(2)-C6 fungal-type domain-containing protein n=1 Tax=Exophiala viscosa TaxID=2486360 RepID=A0AAN6DXP3_9EURO|nr:hypothetical protein EDD36DRAFT_231916 [Exophiala viscosa]